MVAELARIANAITESEIRDMVQQLIATRTQIKRTDVRAPASGMVRLPSAVLWRPVHPSCRSCRKPAI